MFKKVIYELDSHQHDFTIYFEEMVEEMISFMEENEFKEVAVGQEEDKRIVTITELRNMLKLCEHFTTFGNYIEFTHESN